MAVRVAMVGCGGVSRMHFDGLMKHTADVKLVACCDPDNGQRSQVISQYAVPNGFSSVEEMIEGATWDIGIVCTPTPVRSSVIKALASAGKHVLVEKPMASTYLEALEMVQYCKDAGVQIAVDQNFRYHYAFSIAREAMSDGLIGRVTQVIHRDMFFRQDAGWRLLEKRHSMAVMGVHWLDGLRYALDRDAISVAGLVRSSSAIDCLGDTDVTVQIAFEDGPIATYIQSFSSPIGVTETVFVGDRGALSVDYAGVSLFDRSNEPQPIQRWLNERYFGAHGEQKPESSYKCLDLLVQALRTDTEPENSGRDNLKTIALLDAAYVSSEEARVVALKSEVAE